jgi:hypothetical protein
LSHIELFALTYFQFIELYRGWEERQKHDSIKRAEIIATLYNVNRMDESSKVVEIADILPWYSDYAGNGRGTEQDVIGFELSRPIDESVPQLERVTKRLLEEWGRNPNMPRDAPEWIDAEQHAQQILGPGGLEGDTVMLQGVKIKKADPKIWGEKFPDW